MGGEGEDRSMVMVAVAMACEDQEPLVQSRERKRPGGVVEEQQERLTLHEKGAMPQKGAIHTITMVYRSGAVKLPSSLQQPIEQ
jgi:hypothetical protein